jgi:hypothetical protein
MAFPSIVLSLTLYLDPTGMITAVHLGMTIRAAAVSHEKATFFTGNRLVAPLLVALLAEAWLFGHQHHFMV